MVIESPSAVRKLFVCGLMSDAVSGQTSTCRSRGKASGDTGRIDTPHEGMGENFHDEELTPRPRARQQIIGDEPPRPRGGRVS